MIKIELRYILKYLAAFLAHHWTLMERVTTVMYRQATKYKLIAHPVTITAAQRNVFHLYSILPDHLLKALLHQKSPVLPLQILEACLHLHPHTLQRIPRNCPLSLVRRPILLPLLAMRR